MPLQNLTNDDLQKLLQSEPDLQLLDVRTPEEYLMLGHIPQARLLPIHTLPDHLGSLDRNRRTVVVCEHGVRSHDASHYLLQHGFADVAHLSAGMAEWTGEREFMPDVTESQS